MFLKKLLMRTLRLVITSILISSIIFLLVIEPIYTLLALFTIINLFLFSIFPYWIIAAICRKIGNYNYVCIVQPFNGVFITVRKKGYIEDLPQKTIKHEQDHITYFKEGNTIIQSLKYVIYLIWYGYYDNPIEERARCNSKEIENG